jgi:hypothetical protein
MSLSKRKLRPLKLRGAADIIEASKSMGNAPKYKVLVVTLNLA